MNIRLTLSCSCRWELRRIEAWAWLLYFSWIMRHVLIALTLCASQAAAHPHIFVDTGLDLHFDADGRLSEVKVTWAYDEFYSLLITEDRGLDPDFDGVLTPAELADLNGFDMQWTEGFNGDLVILQGARLLALSGPTQTTATYENGRITTTHVRRVDPGQDIGTAIEVKPYDATYYTAYDITLPVRIEGSEVCRQRVEVPDIEAGLLQVRDLLNAMDDMIEDDGADQPDIGITLSSTVHVTCDMS